jgi:Ca-activated chloride channel homolog
MTLKHLAGFCVGIFLSVPAFAEAPRTIIVMDGSGSMWGQINGRTKLEIARETLSDVLGTIPADQQLGLMAYGHRERGNCSDIELMVPPAAGTGAEIAARVNKMRFQGKTPLSEAVRQAAQVLRSGEEAATVVLVTDGLETCEADPCALGRELEAAGLNFTAHVIGFGLTEEEGAQVACLAKETGGQYLQASDAGALTDALTATVSAQLPLPQPAPEPEPEPVLPKASLSAPDSAAAGSVLRVAFEGPHEEFDFIRVLDANGDWQSEAAVGSEPFVELRLPFDLGSYELVYLFRATEVIARKPLQITEAVVSLSAPDSAPAGSTILVEWTGPAAQFDYINLLDAAGKRVAEASIGQTSPVEIGLPWATGAFTLTYLFRSKDVIFSRPITLTPAPVSITAPATAQVGQEVTITWVGPGAYLDNIQFWNNDTGEREGYDYTKDKPDMVWTMPDVPGNYRFAYRFRDSEEIHSTPITVTLERSEATPATQIVPMAVPVTFTGAGTQDYPLAITWSAIPVPGQDLPPEAWAMNDSATGPTSSEFLPGTYEVRGDAGDTVFAGQVTVTAAGPNDFFIPVSDALSPAGPDAAPVTVAITGPYRNAPYQWTAIPLPDGEVLRTVEGIKGQWDVTLIPGQFLVTGIAAGAKGEGLAAVVDITGPGPVNIGQPTYSVAPFTDLPPFHRQCMGRDPCAYHDEVSGLRMVLLPGWLMQDPYPLTTAAGEGGVISTLFGTTGTGGTPLAALNPRQWDASLGPCEDTAAGQLCRAADMPDDALAGYRVIAATLRMNSAMPAAAGTPVGIVGAPQDLDPETAANLRKLLLGQP